MTFNEYQAISEALRKTSEEHKKLHQSFKNARSEGLVGVGFTKPDCDGSTPSLGSKESKD